MKNIIIIGNGIAGITAARHIRKLSDYTITVISKESEYHFSRTALMYVYMGHMRFQDIQPYEAEFWAKNRIQLIHNSVESFNSLSKTVTLETGEMLHYDELILATGSRPAFYNWPGQELKGVQGMYSKQDLENLENLSPNIQTAVVNGGGLIGIELVEMLVSRGIHVHFLIRDTLFWGNILPESDAKFIMNHMNKHHGITLHYSTELNEIIGDSNGNVTSITTKDGATIDCQFVGITTGVVPNKELAESLGIETNRGILVDKQLQTSVPNIYSIGDCAEQRAPSLGRNTVEQVWYTGRIMGETVAQTICGTPTDYEPGHWFNSAKFFDIEYQTYGSVPNQLKENWNYFSWSHPTKEIQMTFCYEISTGKFLGVNTFGIRLRHEVFDAWLTQQKTLEEVIVELKTANFDPEFFQHFEQDILQQYNTQFKTSLSLQPKKWWQTLLTNA